MNYSVKISSDKKGFIKNIAENVSLEKAKTAMEAEANNYDKNNYEAISSSRMTEIISTDFRTNRDLRENFKIEIEENS